MPIKKIILLSLTVLGIFVSYNYVSTGGNSYAEPFSNKLSIKPADFFNINSIVLPLLWSVLFIYLYGKKHGLIAVLTYLIFLILVLAEKLNFGALTINELFTYALFSTSLAILLTFLYQGMFHIRKYRLTYILSFSIVISIIAVPLLFLIFTLSQDVSITKNDLYAVFQTNVSESFEYIIEIVNIQWVILYIFTIGVMGFILLQQDKKEPEEIEKPLLLLVFISLSVITSVHFSELKLPSFIYNEVGVFQKELKLFKKVQKKRGHSSKEYIAKKSAQGETYVIVIGESLNKNNMGIYDYFRDTTPKLKNISKQGNFLIFTNVYSNHTHTDQVLTLSLTKANQVNKESYYSSPSILNVLRQADIETYWLSNQNLQGVWDNKVSVLAHESDHLFGINHSIGKENETQKYDGELINELEKILAVDKKQNRVIFIHLMGNHAGYCYRYPENEYSKYKGKLPRASFGNLAYKDGLEHRLNCYDNSVIYNDYVVSNLLELLQNKNGANGFLYVSDHADDVINGLWHSSNKFSYEMTQIPMIAWFSEKYREYYGNRYNVFKGNVDRLFPNDFLYDTLLGVIGVETKQRSSRFDLSSDEYDFSESEAYTLHGEISYTDKSNTLWWQKYNIKFLNKENSLSRVLPISVNSIGKLNDIWSQGFRSFAIDVKFIESRESYLSVGIDSDVSPAKLEAFISHIDYSNLHNIYLNIDNINKHNYIRILKIINALHERFDIKKDWIIRLPPINLILKEVHAAGWKVSIKIPDKNVADNYKEDNYSGLMLLRNEIHLLTKTYNPESIIFNATSYQFVNKFLVPVINKDIDFLLNFDIGLYERSFENELVKNSFLLDSRIKKILIKYDSRFN